MHLETIKIGDRFPEPMFTAFAGDFNLEKYDLLCFSHLRWDFVFQRPQHSMSRAAKNGRIFFIKEPIHFQDDPYLDVSHCASGVTVVVPRFASDTSNRKYFYPNSLMIL